MTATHAALVRTPRGIEVRTVPTPRPGPGEVLLAPSVVGVCGTDLQILRGLRPDPADVLGHEGTAVVAAVGPGVDGLVLGDQVMVNPTHPVDDTFLLGHNIDGLWAERTLVPVGALTAGLVVAVPQRLGLLAALVEPLAAVRYAAHVALTAVGGPPASLVIWGDGVVGHLARRWWRHRHAAQGRPPGALTVVHVHHGARGLAFSASSDASSAAMSPELPRVIDVAVQDPDLDDLLAALPGPVLAVLATPRDATAQALVRIERTCRAELVVNVLGGVGPEPIQLSGGPVDVARVRAANRAGRPDVPVVARIARDGRGQLTLCGQRGVDTATLTAAVADVLDDPDRYRTLITHEVALSDACDLLNTLAAGDRNFAGRRVVKAAIRVAS